jgi:hypothetical protein
MSGKNLIIILGIGVALILAITSFSSGETVPQERPIGTINIGSLPAYSTGSINGWTCPEKSSDGKQVDRCSISGNPNIGVSLSPGQRWEGYCIAEESSLVMILGCGLAGGETMYGNTGKAFGCCARGKTYTDSQGNIGCSQTVTPVSCNGIRNVETSFSATLYESLIQCPDGSYNYRSLCTQAQNTPQISTIIVTTNLAGASFSISGTSSYSGSGTSWSTTVAPAGTYTITYGAVTGYDTPPSETRTVQAGGSITFSGTYIIPTQTTGSIAVSSIPSGASIYLDGSYQSTTPYTITNVQAGSHTVTLKLSGYQDWSTTVNVVARQTSPVSTPLIQTPQNYVLALYVYDSKTNERLEGAKVYVDNSLKATVNSLGRPDPNIYLLPGTYSVRITKDGCTDASFSVVIPMQDTKYVAMSCNAPATQLTVELVSPSNGATITTLPIEFKVRVTANGNPVKDANVMIYFGNGGSSSSGWITTNSEGYATYTGFSSLASGSTVSWYAEAYKSGYTSGTSLKLGFSYNPSQQPNRDFKLLWDRINKSGITTLYSVNNGKIEKIPQAYYYTSPQTSKYMALALQPDEKHMTLYVYDGDKEIIHNLEKIKIVVEDKAGNNLEGMYVYKLLRTNQPSECVGKIFNEKTEPENVLEDAFVDSILYAVKEFAPAVEPYGKIILYGKDAIDIVNKLKKCVEDETFIFIGQTDEKGEISTWIDAKESLDVYTDNIYREPYTQLTELKNENGIRSVIKSSLHGRQNININSPKTIKTGINSLIMPDEYNTEYASDIIKNTQNFLGSFGNAEICSYQAAQDMKCVDLIKKADVIIYVASINFAGYGLKSTGFSPTIKDLGEKTSSTGLVSYRLYNGKHEYLIGGLNNNALQSAFEAFANGKIGFIESPVENKQSLPEKANQNPIKSIVDGISNFFKGIFGW